MKLTEFVNQLEDILNESIQIYQNAQNKNDCLREKEAKSENLIDNVRDLTTSVEALRVMKEKEEDMNVERIKLRQLEKRSKTKIAIQEEIVENLRGKFHYEISRKDRAFGSRKRLENYLLKRILGFHLDTRAHDTISGAFICLPLSTAELFTVPNTIDPHDFKNGLLTIARQKSNPTWQELFSKNSS